MRITTRLILFVLVIVLVPTSIVSYLAYSNGRRAIENNISTHLTATALYKQDEFNRWIESNENKLVNIANRPLVWEYTKVLISPSAGEDEIRSVYQTLMEDHFLPNLEDGNFVSYSILRVGDGLVVFSTTEGVRGKYRDNELFFIEGKTQTFTDEVRYYPPQNAVLLHISTPIIDRDGSLLGVLVGHANLHILSEIMAQGKELTPGEETFLVNPAFFFVSEPWLGEGKVLKHSARTEAITKCLGGETGVITYTDYRGVTSIGAYRWIPERDLCIITKIDQSIALQPAEDLQDQILTVSLLSTFLIGFLGLYLARTITIPVQRLQEGAERFGQGDLDVRLPEGSRDELGMLAKEFNRMADAISEERVKLRLRTERLFNLSVDFLAIAGFDGYFKDLNPSWSKKLGFTDEELKSKPFIEFVHPEDREFTLKTAERLTHGEDAVSFENRYQTRGGSWRWLEWNSTSDLDERLIYAVAHDVTEQKEAQEELARRADDLARSNAELEQFAYVASHDLQEPLRMVTSYMQLISKRYKGKLDSNADEFIEFAVDGATRMKHLINDLLAFSRVGTRWQDIKPVSSDLILRDALDNLKIAVKESGAQITHDPLPMILADGAQIVQVFQNLLSNAIKFRTDAPPRVHMGVEQVEGPKGEAFWEFCIRDNGIGIEQQYFERVFVIFQRLHNKDVYSGTGIGLAICKKIIERHGGRIWVKSEIGQGSTFYFTLRSAD